MLTSDELDIGTPARTTISSMEDDELPIVSDVVIDTAVAFIQRFWTKMASVIPFGDLRLFQYLHPEKINQLKVENCMLANENNIVLFVKWTNIHH